MAKFEKLNHFSVNVFGNKNQVHALYLTKPTFKKHVDFLYWSETVNSHYCYIKSFNALMFTYNKFHRGKFLCKYCLHTFGNKDLLMVHMLD